MNDKEIGEIGRKLNEIDPSGKLLNEFFYADDKDAWIKNAGGRLEGYRTYTDVYKNLEDFMADKYKVMNDLYTQLGGVKPSDARMYSINQKYKNIDRDELNEWFDKTNEYKAYYEEERNQEALKEERKQEVKDWNLLQNILASDYSKQRYIEDPNASIFGKQGNFNPYSTQGQEELRDVILGGTGAVADLIPKGGAFIGPAVRGIRDIEHRYTDSPYQKEWSQIGTDFGKDLSLNLGAWLLNNVRKGAKAANAFKDPEVARTMKMDEVTKNVKEGVKSTNVMDVWTKYDDKTLINIIENLPESPMKKELMGVANNAYPGKPLNRQAISNIHAKYQYLTGDGGVKAAQDYMKGNWKSKPFFGKNEYVREMSLTTPYEDLTRAQKLKYQANIVANQLNSGWPGQMMMQEGYTATGRGKAPNVVETALKKSEKEATIDRLISSYSLLWNKDKEPPEAKKSPIIMEAWKKWKEQE